MTRGSIPPLLLEQLELDELTPERRAAIEAEFNEREREAEARAGLRASDAEVLRDYPPERVMGEVRRRAAQAEAKPARGWLPWLLVPGVAGAAALALVVLVGGRESPTGGHAIARLLTGVVGPETTRIKGGARAHLVVDRKLASGHERLGAGDSLREGDLVQISVVPDGAAQGVIVSIDGRGVVTLHHPATPEAPASLPSGGEVPLPNSYELDDAPSFERFVLITRSDDAAIDVAAVLAAAEQLAADPTRARSEPLPLAGAGWQQSSLELAKLEPGSPNSAEVDP